MLLAGYSVSAVSRLREPAIVVIFLLPLALGVMCDLLTCLRWSHVTREIWAWAIATVGSTLRYHFEHFRESARPSTFGPVAAAEGLSLMAKGLNGQVSQKSNYGHRLAHATTCQFRARKKARDARRFPPLRPQPLGCDNAPQKTDQKIGPRLDYVFTGWKIRLRVWSRSNNCAIRASSLSIQGVYLSQNPVNAIV